MPSDDFQQREQAWQDSRAGSQVLRPLKSCPPVPIGVAGVPCGRPPSPTGFIMTGSYSQSLVIISCWWPFLLRTRRWTWPGAWPRPRVVRPAGGWAARRPWAWASGRCTSSACSPSTCRFRWVTTLASPLYSLAVSIGASAYALWGVAAQPAVAPPAGAWASPPCITWAWRRCACSPALTTTGWFAASIAVAIEPPAPHCGSPSACAPSGATPCCARACFRW